MTCMTGHTNCKLFLSASRSSTNAHSLLKAISVKFSKKRVHARFCFCTEVSVHSEGAGMPVASPGFKRPALSLQSWLMVTLSPAPPSNHERISIQGPLFSQCVRFQTLVKVSQEPWLIPPRQGKQRNPLTGTLHFTSLLGQPFISHVSINSCSRPNPSLGKVSPTNTNPFGNPSSTLEIIVESQTRFSPNDPCPPPPPPLPYLPSLRPPPPVARARPSAR